MPRELLRVDDHISWLRTIIRKRSYGIETEFHFMTSGGLLQVAIDTLAHFNFLSAVIHLECLAIRDRSLAERGWTEKDRFEVRINDNDEVAFQALYGSYVRWGPDSADDQSEFHDAPP
jgi:hypothetical protein